AWAKQAAHTDVIAKTDPDVGARFAELNDALRGFGERDATADALVATAREAVYRATRAYWALQARMPGAYRAPAAHYARMTGRPSLLTMLATIADPDASPRGGAEALGDRHLVGDECPHCGAPLEDLYEPRCAHCRVVLEREPDAWQAARVALFRATLRERHQ